MRNNPPAPGTGQATYSEPPDVNYEPDNSNAPTQPPSPIAWTRGRDPYAVDGMTAQPQFAPAGAPPPGKGALLLASGINHFLLFGGGRLLLSGGVAPPSLHNTSVNAVDQSLNFSADTQQVPLSAIVSSPDGTVNTGSVTFSVVNSNNMLIGAPVTAAVSGGVASVTYMIPGSSAAGNYRIVANHNPGTGFRGSSDSGHTLSVRRASTSIAAGSQTAPFSTAAQPATLSAVVISDAGAISEGTVTFTVLDGNNVQVGAAVTSAPVVAGAASVVYTLPGNIAAGNYQVTTVYNPGVDYLTSSDGGGVLAVSVLPFSDVFERYTVGSLPSVWAQHDDLGNNGVKVVAGSVVGGVNSLTSGGNRLFAAFRNDVVFPDDVIVSGSVRVQSSISGNDGSGVFARGSGMGTSAPFCYAAGALRDGGISLFLYNGSMTPTKLTATVTTVQFQNANYRASLHCQGASVKASLKVTSGPNAGKYVNSDGSLTAAGAQEVFALVATDATIASGGQCGFFKNSAATNLENYDDFSVVTSAADVTPPTCALVAPTGGTTWNSGNSQPAVLTVTATDNIQVLKVEWFISDDGYVSPIATVFQGGTGNAGTSYSATIPSQRYTNGAHSVKAKTTDTSGNIAFSSTVSVTVAGSQTPTRPAITRAHSWLGLYGNQYDNTQTAQALAVAPNFDIGNVAGLAEPATRTARPVMSLLAYNNISNTYTSPLMDWLNYADAHSLSREAAFFHAAATYSIPNQLGGGTVPPSLFWQIFNDVTFTDIANNAYIAYAQTQYHYPVPIWPASSSKAFYVGYPERFRSLILVGLVAPAGGWTATLQYCTGVDGSGVATSWSTLPVLTDGTSGLTAAGTIDFDPPADWVPCKAASQPGGIGSAGYRYFYVRWLVTVSGTAPTATGLKSADYSGEGLAGSPVSIPAYDYAKDSGNKGWLTAAEYAGRATGKDAHFVYQSRGPTAYGSWRFSPNVSSASYQAWAVAYNVAYVSGGDFDGIFMDNSGGTASTGGGTFLESMSTYLTDYAVLLQTIWNSIGSGPNGTRWVLANTGGAPLANIQAIVGYSPAVFQEGELRPFHDDWHSFGDHLNRVAAIQSAVVPEPINVVDSSVAYFPTAVYGSGFNGQKAAGSDPQNKYNNLCEYYMMASANTFISLWTLDLTGGDWSLYHFVPAMLGDVGSPSGLYSTLVTGSDPDDTTLTYKVFQRVFANALVLYKPLSSKNNGATVGTWRGGSTLHNLGGTYYKLNPDNTHGAAITTISLTNGEGAILLTAP